MASPDLDFETAEPPALPAPPHTTTTAAPRPTPPVEPFHTVLLHAAQHLLQQHPALALTLGYLFLTAIGMIYEFLFFSEFQIQIFDFADPTDFILVAVRKPMLLLFTVSSVLAMVRLIRKREKWKARSRHLRTLSQWLVTHRAWRFLQPICYLVFVASYFVVFTSAYADHNAGAIRSGHGREVLVELISESSTPGHAPTSYILLGATTRYLLLYNPTAHRAEVLPLNNVARLSSR